MTVKSPESGAEAAATDRANDGGNFSSPDEGAALLSALETARRKLAIANLQLAGLKRERERNRSTIRRLKRLAATDVLTSLYNRRRFERSLAAEFIVAVDRETPLSVIMVDVDCFKSYNDTFGHAAGDVVLRAVARHLVDFASPMDLVARYGGDEFAILLRGADENAAQARAELCRAAIERFPWPQRPVTASFGVATRTDWIENPAALLEEADRALYDSKRGRRAHRDCPEPNNAGDTAPK